MVINKEQRIGIFVDVQNLYYSARALHNSRVNFKEILKAIASAQEVVSNLKKLNDLVKFINTRYLNINRMGTMSKKPYPLYG